MAVITVQASAVEGSALTFDSAAAAGDNFVNTGAEILVVRRGVPGTAGNGASTRTVTVTPTTATDAPLSADYTITGALVSGATLKFGPFATELFGLGVTMTMDDETFITVAVVKVGTGI